MKFRFPKIKIVYHEHNGERLKQNKKDNFLLLMCSLFFERILTVNPEIEKWLKQNLWCKKSIISLILLLWMLKKRK